MQTIIMMVVLYAWVALTAALLGLFYPAGIFGTWFIICSALFFKKILSFSRPSREMILYIGIAIVFTLCVAATTVPTIFAGRDQGSLATAAIQLAQNHTLVSYSPESTAFFRIYGPGKALNFPGFYYLPDGGLLTQFPLPYITFLGGFFGLAGMSGLIIANSILLCIFIISITFVARTFLDRRHTLLFLLILLSSFVIGWFDKFTLSENIAGMLLWSAVALLLALRTARHTVTYYVFLLTISLLLFARIEGVWFFCILFYLANYTTEARAFLRRDLWQSIFLPAAVLATYVIMIAIMNEPFFLTMAHVLKDSTQETTSAAAELSKKYIYLFSIYGMYGLLAPLLLALATIVCAAYRKQYRPILFIALIIAPLFLYYFYPQISSDHPWMLRRFVFALVPATILISVFGIAHITTNNLSKKIGVYTAYALLCVTNIPAFVSFILYAENTTLLTQTQMLAELIGPNDLVLVDKNAAGNGWSMITTPLRSLERKHAVYFFNPYDLPKVDRSQFDHTLLIVPDENDMRYREVFGDRMQEVTRYYLAVDQLGTASQKILPPLFPMKNTTIVHGTIYEIK